ncbi:MAG: class I SAM-dependent methyltransferase family protein [Candidatus Paceibacteria bacterium]
MKRILPEVKYPVRAFENLAWPYLLFLPFMFVIGLYVRLKQVLYRAFGGPECAPKTNSWFFDGLSINGRKVKDGSARWPALEAVYNFREGEGGTRFVRAIDSFWLHIRNAQAVRNRLSIVEQSLLKAILKVAETKEGDEPVRILSIAAGSGQAVIETVERLYRAGVRCEVVLIDQDESALTYARKLAAEHGLEAIVDARKGNAVAFYRELHGFVPDIIEMCGLMDYLDDKLAIALIKKIRRYLHMDGFFLTCHIHPNLESYFLRYVINWGMLYRTKHQLADLLVEGGFLSAKLYTEPHLIHSVAVAQKL